MRVNKHDMDIAARYCEANGCTLLGYKSDGFVYRSDSGKDRTLAYTAAAALMGIPRQTRRKKRTNDNESINSLVMRAVMDDLRAYEKYEAQTRPDGIITFDIPAYSCICRVLDNRRVHFLAIFTDPISNESHISIDRTVTYR